MIATRSVERGRSALHKSSQLHSRLLYSSVSHSRQLMISNSNSNSNSSINININLNLSCCRRHTDLAGRLFQDRHAHTGVPFGRTSVYQDEEPPSPPPGSQAFSKPPSQPDSGRSGTLPYYHAALEALLKALRQGDTFSLYLCLMNLVRGHETDAGSSAFTKVVASIPATTFSEILRSFDPYKVAEEIDTAPGVNISYGLAVHTPLGELVNKWGVKVLYVRILRRLLQIQLARRKAGLVPLLNDYVVLIRCAGANSDIRAAKRIWSSMIDDGRSNIRHLEAYAEFIKARYLTEKLYANNDLSRFRQQALHTHPTHKTLPLKVRLRLRNLSSRITARRKHRFGSNIDEHYYDESLARVLRKRLPLRHLIGMTVFRGLYNRDEALPCALLKANGRTGRIKHSNTLLKHNWGLILERDRTTGVITIEGGHTYPPDSPRAPTAALLDAIVHSYCSSGEVTMAVRLVDYVSQRFSIPVPDQVWSDLIEYTRVMQAKPAATEWHIADFPRKGARPDTTLEVWRLCTQEPYSFRPGAKDYYNLIRSLVRKSGPMVDAIEALRQIKPLYDDSVRACEEAWCALMQTTQQAMPNHGAYRRYRVLQARRNHMWYMFHHTIFLILKKTRPGRVDDHSAVRAIPKLIADFAEFLPPKFTYSIATGVVGFYSGAVQLRNVSEVDQTVWEPSRTREAGMSDKDDGDARGLQEHVQDDYPEDGDDFEPATTATFENKDNREDDTLGSDKPSPEDGQGQGHTETSRWVVRRTLVGRRVVEKRVLVKRVLERRVVEKPAYNHRPPWPAQVSLRRDGGEFIGYHDDPERVYFAAYRTVRTTRRVVGVPVDLEWSGDGKENKKKRRLKMVDELLRMRS